MTKEKFIEETCKHCINKSTICSKHIKVHKDEFNVVYYACSRYRNIFECCKKDCNSCGKCGYIRS